MLNHLTTQVPLFLKFLSIVDIYVKYSYVESYIWLNINLTIGSLQFESKDSLELMKSELNFLDTDSNCMVHLADYHSKEKQRNPGFTMH